MSGWWENKGGGGGTIDVCVSWVVGRTFRFVLSVETMRIPRTEGCGPPDGTNVASYVMNGIAAFYVFACDLTLCGA